MLALAGIAMGGVVHCQDWPALVEQVRPSMVHLSTPEDEGVCTAIAIAPQTFLTAAHCVVCAMAEGPPMPCAPILLNQTLATPTFISMERDVALLTGYLDAPLIILEHDPLHAGDPVLMLGFGFNHATAMARRGIVADAYEWPTGLVWTDIIVVPGDSGGALVNTRGHLVALITAAHGQPGFTFLTVAVGAPLLDTILRSEKVIP